MLKAKENYLNFLRSQIQTTEEILKRVHPIHLDMELRLLDRIHNLQKEIYELELDEEETENANDKFEEKRIQHDGIYKKFGIEEGSKR